MGYLLVETSVRLIENHIKATIASELAIVIADYGNAVQLSVPRSYFIYQKSKAFQLPAIFTICEEFDYRLERGPNQINALARVNVEILCEDRVRDLLTLKMWRYQAALTRMFDGTHIDNGDNRVRIVTKLLKSSFSDLYFEPGRDPEDPNTTFIGGVMVELEVEHYENNS